MHDQVPEWLVGGASENSFSKVPGAGWEIHDCDLSLYELGVLLGDASILVWPLALEYQGQ